MRLKKEKKKLLPGILSWYISQVVIGEAKTRIDPWTMVHAALKSIMCMVHIAVQVIHSRAFILWYMVHGTRYLYITINSRHLPFRSF